MNREQKIQLLDQANIECNWGNPKSKIIDLPNWAQIITLDAKHSSANCVFRSRLSHEKVRSKIDQTVAFYEEMKVPFRWLLTPLTEPQSIEALLLNKGLSLHYEAAGMMCPVKEQIQPFDGDISIVSVDLTNIDLYVETFIRSWQLPSFQATEFKEDVRYGLEHGNGRFIPFVAYFKGDPVGTSALLNIPSGGYLAAGTVDQKYRGRGIYKAMVSHRAKVAKELGHSNLLIHAKKLTAAPICRKLGFESVYDYQVFSRELL